MNVWFIFRVKNTTVVNYFAKNISKIWEKLICSEYDYAQYKINYKTSQQKSNLYGQICLSLKNSYAS